jgi:hypothetical protein
MRAITRARRPHAALLALACCAVAGCASVSTSEQWYPNYSKFRVAQDKSIIVFVHGYGGSEETFHVVPYLQAALDPGNTTTVMYFNYDTGALQSNLSSIGQISSDFRVFLEDHVFSLREPVPSRQRKPFLNVICHSTGCPIVRQYIANNLLNHGIAKVLAVAGANYGAYYAESASWLKRQFDFLQGDKQVNELKYGSFTLMTLQERFHFLETNCDFAPEQADDRWAGDRLRRCQPKDTRFLSETPFKVFACDPHNPGSASDYCDAEVYLPQIIPVIGTDDWAASGVKKFSDTVVRFESALIDCRLLRPIESGEEDIFRMSELDSPCDDRAIVVLPCKHTEVFSRPDCQGAVVRLADYFLIDKGPGSRGADQIAAWFRARLAAGEEGCSGAAEPARPDPAGDATALARYEREWKREVFKCYYRTVQGSSFRKFMGALNTAALWVKVLDDGLPGADPSNAGALEKALERVRLKISTDAEGAREADYDAPWPLHLIESDFRQATRSSTLRAERIFYFRYLKTDRKGTPRELYLHISELDEQGQPHRQDAQLLGSGGVRSALKVKIHPGQTTMVDCRNYRGKFECVALAGD